MRNQKTNNQIIPRKGPGAKGDEKAKNFKSAIVRLIKELKSFKVLIIISLVLAGLGSVLSIMTPDKLSEMTDEISKGLVINKTNFEDLVEMTTNSLNEEEMIKIIPQILQIDLSQETIGKVMSSQDISNETKQSFKNVLDKISTSTNQNQIFNYLIELPDEILNFILPETTYNDIVVSTNDKISFLEIINAMNSEQSIDKSIPNSVANIIFSEIEIDGTTISPTDQGTFLSIAGTILDNADVQELYS